MAAPVMKISSEAAAQPLARIVNLPPRIGAGFGARLSKQAARLAAHVAPPLVVVALMLLAWQLGFSRPGSSRRI